MLSITQSSIAKGDLAIHSNRSQGLAKAPEQTSELCMHPKNIKLWLLTLFLALSVRFCAGLYYLYIGCSKILGECYKEGADAAFWPITVSTLIIYISVLAVIIIITARIFRFLARFARRMLTSKRSN